MAHLAIEGSDTTDKVEAPLIVATDCVSNGTLLLENEEFDKESGGYKSEKSDDESVEEHEERNVETNDHLGHGNDISKKRKASQKLQGSKKKKQRSEPREAVATEIPRESEYIEILHENEVQIGKNSKAKKGKLSMNDKRNTGGANSRHDEKTKKDVDSASNLKINEQFQEKGEDVDGATNISGSSQKFVCEEVCLHILGELIN